ncbi:MAG: hypothetical protein HYY84_02220 [Deltaproteobacteria bacterium]|nr:hypothetical protein [Deltaproteobacteria bacterium]
MGSLRALSLVPVLGNAGVSISFPERRGADNLWVGRVNATEGRSPTSGNLTLSSIGTPGQAITGSFSASPVYNGSNTASVTISGGFSARYEGSGSF